MPKNAPCVLILCLRFQRRSRRAALSGSGCEGDWDSLKEAEEVWALRKMGYFKIGQRS
jgi:predicted lipid-binding transport protein (Tim44 family)